LVLLCHINDGDAVERDGRSNTVWYLTHTGDWVSDQDVTLAKASGPVPACPEKFLKYG
jgi:hypothetical protein